MSFTLGWPAAEPALSSTSHLRIKDLARKIDALDAPLARDRHVAAQASQLRNSFDLSVSNIDDNIYALAAATAALDKVEGKLTQAKTQIEDLVARGQPVDLAKVERTLMALAGHINQSVRQADEHNVNMLRDTRLQIRISEVGGHADRARQVDLTLISMDKLIGWKLRDGPSDPQAWIELIGQMSRVATQNVQILSSLILTLFAARDYTSDVVDLVITPPADQPHRGTSSAIASDFVHSARTALLREERLSAAPMGASKRLPAYNPALPEKSPNRLMAFLKDVAFQV